jgi:hypothetical protein
MDMILIPQDKGLASDPAIHHHAKRRMDSKKERINY